MKRILFYLFMFFIGSGATGQIVINEINYKDAIGFETKDWIELYNNGIVAVNISNWVFKDDDDLHEFVIPNGTAMPPNSYLVLVQSLADFQIYFPGVSPVLGDFGFGLSGGGELIRLFDNNGVLIDYVEYSDMPPWPTEPDGNGPTLELKNPNWDNTLASSWAASVPPNGLHGTPGEINSTFTLGIEDMTTSKISVYPNPLTSKTVISVSNTTSPLKLVIYDLLGREIDVMQTNSNHFILERENFKTGVYILKLTTEIDSVSHIQKIKLLNNIDYK